MSSFKDRISILIQNQVPAFVRQDHELFVSFMEAYYEYMEQNGYPLAELGTHKDNLNVDETDFDTFYSHFKDMYLRSFPEDMVGDKASVIKWVKKFYNVKGQEKSVKFLFKILFGEDVTITYPKESILRASDGKWIQDTSIFVEAVSGDPFDLLNENIVGLTSGASATIDNIILTTQGIYDVYEFKLSGLIGSFQEGETIESTSSSSTVEVSSYGIVTAVDITDGGTGYSVGDNIPITDPGGYGINAVAEVFTTEDLGGVSSFVINNGGTGYRVGDPLIFTPISEGFGALAEVASLTGITTESINTDIIADVQNVVINTIPETTLIQDWLTFENIDYGTIASITLTETGQEYDAAPTVTVGTQTPDYGIDAGTGADIDAVIGLNGVITSMIITNPGIGYRTSSTPTADFTGEGDGTATGTVTVSGGPHNFPGRWEDNRGKISSTMHLFDGEYYQLYSYVLNSGVSISEWDTVVRKTVHPAGMKFFGSVLTVSEIDATPNLGCESTIDLDTPELLTATAGSLTITGQTGTLVTEQIIAATAGSMTITGQQGSMQLDVPATATAGSMTITGETGAFQLGIPAYATADTLTITGNTGEIMPLLPDGSKLYMVGTTGSVYQYGMTTPWDMSTGSYDSKSATISGEDGTPTGLYMSYDGTKMYMLGTTADTVYQYTLSTPWDVSTASYASKSKSVNAEDASPTELYFSPDGNKMFMVGFNTDSVYQYSMSTPWDVSTASYDSKSKSVTTEENTPTSLDFSPDGTKMYVSGLTNGTIYQYTLSTAWDVSTASYASKSYDATTQSTFPQGIRMKADGTKVYIMDYSADKVFQYSLSTAWDISTASYDTKSLDISGEDGNSRGICFGVYA